MYVPVNTEAKCVEEIAAEENAFVYLKNILMGAVKLVMACCSQLTKLIIIRAIINLHDKNTFGFINDITQGENEGRTIKSTRVIPFSYFSLRMRSYVAISYYKAWNEFEK